MEPSNILRIDNLTDSWCDKDHVLLHACFQLLSDFVEKEIPKYPFINWNIPVNKMNFVMREVQFHADKAEGVDPANTRDIKKEFEELYIWWQQWRQREATKKNSNFEDDHTNYLEENEMLKRLIDLRMYMWT
jgi:hypothetical protein